MRVSSFLFVAMSRLVQLSLQNKVGTKNDPVVVVVVVVVVVSSPAVHCFHEETAEQFVVLLSVLNAKRQGLTS